MGNRHDRFPIFVPLLVQILVHHLQLIVFTCISNSYNLNFQTNNKIRRTFATSSEICSQQVSGLSLEKREQRLIMARDLMQGKRLYDRLKNQARQQMALMNKCRMLSRRTGRGGQQPFYMQFLNR